MGKIRRVRQKFHLASSRKCSNENHNVESRNEETADKPTLPVINLSPNENIFAGIDIDVNQLQRSLLEDETVSVRSVAKSCKYDRKGKLLTKLEKRKLRHNLFLQKIDAIQQLTKETKKKKHTFLGTSVIDADPVSGKQHIHNKIPSQSQDETQDRKKLKGIKKTKQRQKMMVDNIAAFHRILHNPTFRSDPYGVISEIIQKKIYEEK